MNQKKYNSFLKNEELLKSEEKNTPLLEVKENGENIGSHDFVEVSQDFQNQTIYTESFIENEDV
jgi:hypothetical protein